MDPATPMTTSRLSRRALSTAAGLPAEPAEAVARGLVEADLLGHTTAWAGPAGRLCRGAR